jgi:beta-glucosidase-like glycosyl hydrolase
MSWGDYIEKHVIPHRRGIMGTVIFHLVLAILLLGMEISRVAVHAEMEVLMDVPAPEELLKQQEEKQRKEEIRQKSSAEAVEKMLRSMAVNENAPEQKRKEDARVQEYVDAIMKELEEEGGSRYVAQKDKNYKHDSLQHLRDRREQELDSLKSTFYSGESSVSYNLKERYARFLPIPVFKCEFGGVVVVEITVNRKGVVQKAVVTETDSEEDDCLRRVAVDAAERSRFNEKSSAPALQKGTITYHFVKQ